MKKFLKSARRRHGGVAYAEACKAFYSGSIPDGASRFWGSYLKRRQASGKNYQIFW